MEQNTSMFLFFVLLCACVCNFMSGTALTAYHLLMIVLLFVTFVMSVYDFHNLPAFGNVIIAHA